jgi:hypothetical protein
MSKRKKRELSQPQVSAGSDVKPLIALAIGSAWFLVPALYLVTAMPWLATAPFHGDDYVFLDRVMRPAFHFASVWNRHATIFGWYRPWSRELHFWALYHLFGTSEPMFHVVNGALWAITIGLYALLVRQFSSAPMTWFAVTGAMAAAVWTVPLLWASGSQDLWMQLFLMAALLAWSRGRSVLTACLLIPALLSKENAIMAPLLFVAYSLVVDRRTIRDTARALLPTLVALTVWLVVHPTILAHVFQQYEPDPAVVAARQPLSHLAALSLLAPFNLDHVTREFIARSIHFDANALRALPLVACGIWCWFDLKRSRRNATGVAAAGITPAAQMLFGGLWWLIGSAPAFGRSVAWHSYYVSPGVLGAWIAVAGLCRVRPAVAFAILAIAIAAREPRLSTPDWDWGAFPAQERAGRLARELRLALLRELPNVPPHSRLFFAQVPRGIGFVTSDGPIVRVMYRDTTLRAGFWGQYAPRATNEVPGTDYFLTFVPPAGWNLVRPNDQLPSSSETAELWETDHHDLALLLGQAGDWKGAMSEVEQLVRYRPDSDEYRANLEYCRRRAEASK